MATAHRCWDTAGSMFACYPRGKAVFAFHLSRGRWGGAGRAPLLLEQDWAWIGGRRAHGAGGCDEPESSSHLQGRGRTAVQFVREDGGQGFGGFCGAVLGRTRVLTALSFLGDPQCLLKGVDWLLSSQTCQDVISI